jgi:hypothetical protein
MSNLLVETKNEYTIRLVNILNPLIFEGLVSVYNDAKKAACDGDVLKVFQSFLRQIPKWNQELIEQETSRIINASKSYDWLNDLIKATLKANLVILMHNPTSNKQTRIDQSYYQNIRTSEFIHKVYIECARELWNNPYLMYHSYPPLEIKRNQRDCICIIKDAIKEAIRKLLPVKHILQTYLGEDINMNNIHDDVGVVMTDVERQNLGKMIEKDLANNNNMLEIEYNSPSKPVNNMIPSNMMGGKLSTNSEEKTIGSRILNIIKSPNMSEQRLKKNNSSSSEKMKGGMIKKNSEKFSSTSSSVDNFESAKLNSKSLDEKLKNILKKDLATDSDLETSLDYSKEDNNDKYQEIFSNSLINNKDNNAKSKETKTNDIDKDKKKFFNNYLQF